MLTLNGAGIINNSAAGTTQNVIVGAGSTVSDAGARLDFRIAATIGAGVTLTARGSTLASTSGLTTLAGGYVRFYDTATAGGATIVNEGHAGTSVPGVRTQFFGNSSAANATITNGAGQSIGATATFGLGGVTEFLDHASAGNAVITNVGLSRPGFPGGGSLTAADARITNENGGLVQFVGPSRLGASTIRNFGGAATRPMGAYIIFQGTAHGDTATVVLEGATASGAQGTQLYVSANAALENAAVTANGAAVAGGGGGLIQLDGPSRAGNATLVANGGINGGSGERVIFQSGTSGFLA